MSPADPHAEIRHRLRFLEARVQAHEDRLDEVIRLITEHIEGQTDDGR